MKLLSIKFKNIHSLKGEHEVRFDHEPLNSAGIFAITGATGAGKSSLLDVISLALYNQIPRFSSKISKSDIHRLGSVVTHFTDEAWAEVTYQTRQAVYRSRWEISKTRNGTWRDYDMSIIDVSTGKQLDRKKSEVPGANEALIGLNYDQFSKSILLSQGEFSKFLKSKKSDRSKLLEDITGTHIYRDIGAKVFEIVKEKKQAVEIERAKLDTIEFLGDELRFEKIGSIKQLQTDLGKLNSVEDKLKKNKEIKKIAIECEEAKRNINQDEQELKTLASIHAVDQVNYKVHLALTPHAPDMKSLKDARQSKVDVEKQISNSQKNVKQHQDELASAIKKMSLFVGQELTSDSFMIEMKSFQKRISDYDIQLNQLKAKGRDIRSRISEGSVKLSPTVSTQLTQKVNPSDAINILEDRFLEIGSKDTVATKDLITQKNQLRKTIEIVQQWSTVKSQKSVKVEKGKNLIEIDAEIKSKLVKSEKLIDQAKKAITLKDQTLSLQQKENEKAIAHATLEERRSLLVDDEPCPLCGSTDHPYALHQAYQDAGQSAVATQRLKEEKQLLEIELRKASQVEATLKGELEANTKTSLSVKSEIDVLQQEEDKLLAKKSELKDIDVNSASVTISNLQKEMAALDQRLNHQQEITSAQSIIKDYRTLSQILIDFKKINQRRSEFYKGTDVYGDADVIQDRFAVANTSIERETTRVDEAKNRLEELAKQIKTLSESLSGAVSNLGFAEIDEAHNSLMSVHESNRISKAIEKIKHLSSALDTKKEALTALNGKLVGKEIPIASVQEIDEELHKVNKNIQESNQLMGSLEEQIKQDDEKIKQHKESNEILQKRLKENRKYELLSQYIGDAQGSKFSNYAQELTLSRLLSIANVRLKQMNDRYILKHDLDDDDLIVIDQYQGNAERVVRTLSGGESFIISLALALSLSDLASKSVSLESLFIDEGFGTLDPETLDMALSTLEKLQNESGKTIGVISHVEALKERMQTKIMINKNAQGFSEIEIVG